MSSLSLNEKFNQIIKTIEDEDGTKLLTYLDILYLYIKAKTNNIIIDSPDFEADGFSNNQSISWVEVDER